MDPIVFLRAAWLFVVGVIVAVAGICTLLAVPAVGATSFLIMLIGLFFTGAGSIYGKGKFRGDFDMGTEEVSDIKKERVEAQTDKTEEFLESAEQAEEQKVEPPETEEETQTPEAPVGVKVVKVIICPKCGTENQETDTFCFSCGKKLRLKDFKKKK